MNILDKEFAEIYPEIVDTFKIESKPYCDKGKYTVFTVPTQHFPIDSLDELTEETFLKHINEFSWFNRNLVERKINGIRKITLEKILNENKKEL